MLESGVLWRKGWGLGKKWWNIIMNGHGLVKIEHGLSKLLDDMVLSGMTQRVELKLHLS